MVLKGGICLCKKVKILEWKKVSLLILQLLFLVMKSTEMKELFRDDKIYGIVESDSEMSKFISMFEDSEDIYEGKERAVGTLQVAAGRHGDHEHKLGEVAEQKPIQEMDIHYDAGFSVPQFSRCGDCKSEEIQELDAVLIQDNKFSDVKEETGKVIPQVFAEQCNNHKQRMVEEVPKSAYTPVSDENTYANSALKKDDSRSADDKSTERIENVRKIDAAESSSKDINFDSESYWF